MADDTKDENTDNPQDEQGARAALVVVGVDGSPGSVAAARWAIAEAARRDADLHVVCAWDPEHPSVADGAVPPGERVPESHEVAERRAGAVLRAALMSAEQPRRLVLSTPRGPVGASLVAAARDADLFVLGTTYLPRKGRAGEVTTYCLVNAAGPLVFVPAPPPVA